MNFIDKHNYSMSIGVAVIVTFVTLYFYLFSPSSTKTKKNNTRKALKEPKKLIVAGPYTKEEVAKHDHRNDAWIIVEDKVYDITDFIDMHPGGDTILNNVGGDSTIGFKGPQHPVNAWDVLNERYIGNLLKN